MGGMPDFAAANPGSLSGSSSDASSGPWSRSPEIHAASVATNFPSSELQAVRSIFSDALARRCGGPTAHIDDAERRHTGTPRSPGRQPLSVLRSRAFLLVREYSLGVDNHGLKEP